MPVISVGRDKLFQALGREYSELLLYKLYKLLLVRLLPVYAPSELWPARAAGELRRALPTTCLLIFRLL